MLYYVIYHVPLSLIKDTYGLFSGRKEPQSFTDFWGMVSTGYVRIVNGLYFYLGEKATVITGLHILCGFLSFLLLFLSVRRFYKPVLTYGIPAVFFAGCFALGVWLIYDGWILFAFGLC
ncbi:MAG: hypothetical protein IJ711_02430, partial [Lachnospiraceae bacterium]|nr:hypothetical protein [Lachnospiraceae bacterium]